MQFTGGYGGYDPGNGLGHYNVDNRVDQEIANQIQRFGNIRFSNFLLTVSTNVRPEDQDGGLSEEEEEAALTRWLRDNLTELFGSFYNLNGNVLKPAGSPNSNREEFPFPNKIGTVKSRIGIERGAAQKGQVHAHILLEVMHRYDTPIMENGPQDANMDKDYLGVHINVAAMREWLNQRIPGMQIDNHRRPLKVYVNSKLLTKNNDNTNKWLTYAYINKDVAKDNYETQETRNLRVDRAVADPELKAAARTIQNHTVSNTTVRAPQPPVQEYATVRPPAMNYQRPAAPQPRNFR